MTLLSRRLDMVTPTWRESVMKARMQPVSNMCISKMPRDRSRFVAIAWPPRAAAGRRPDTELDKSVCSKAIEGTRSPTR